MSDLIDRDALLQDMTHRGGLGIGDWHVFDVINEQPAIEAEPVQHGRWILCKDQYNVDNDNGNYAYYCSCCEHQDVHAESAKVSFCWNCGADMRGGTDDA